MIGTLVILAVLFVFFPLVPVIPGICFVTPIVNGLFVIMILVLAVAMSIEGTKVIKLVKQIQANSNSTSKDIVETISKLVVRSSVALIVTMLALIITALARVPKDNSPLCMGSLALYRVLELVVMGILTIPLRNADEMKSKLKVSHPTTDTGL